MKNLVLKNITGLAVRKEVIKSKIVNFLKEEKSAKGQAEEGWGVYQNIIIGVIILTIGIGIFNIVFNDIGNYLIDGVNGEVDQSGLNKWSDKSGGFNQK